jgi:peptidoglycan/xylan/chitin deacetylase (PgdA/CDA1 family)
MAVCLAELYRRGVRLEQNPVIPVLALHRFGKGGLSSTGSPWMNSSEYLDRLFKFISRSGFNVIALSQLQAYMIGQDPKLLPSRPLVLTLDDGSRTVLEYFHERASRYGYPYAVSLITASIASGKAKTIEEYGIPDTMLTWEEVRAMESSGLVEFTSHSHAAHVLTQRADDINRRGPALTTQQWLSNFHRAETGAEYRQRIYTDLRQARVELENNANLITTILAWPYGDYNEAAQSAALTSGYTHFLRFGPSRLNTARWDTRQIDRISVTRADEAIPLALPEDSHSEQQWWLAFLKVARQTANAELIEATLNQLTHASAVHPEAELSRAALDALQGHSVRGRARIEQLLKDNPQEPSVKSSAMELYKDYERIF